MTNCFHFFVLSFIFCFFGMTVSGQTAQPGIRTEISGRVTTPPAMRLRLRDGSGFIDIPAADAKVELIIQGDTLQTRADQNGSFSFRDLTPGPAHLFVHFPPIESYSEIIELFPGDNIALVYFKDESSRVTQLGDTLVYDVDPNGPLNGGIEAYDRLLQFPGVEVKDKKIVISDKSVHYRWGNGALFFYFAPDE